MLLGLCNAPATFHHFINAIFLDILAHFLIIYLDDILICSKDLDLHDQHVCSILKKEYARIIYGPNQRNKSFTEKLLTSLDILSHARDGQWTPAR